MKYKQSIFRCLMFSIPHWKSQLHSVSNKKTKKCDLKNIYNLINIKNIFFTNIQLNSNLVQDCRLQFVVKQNPIPSLHSDVCSEEEDKLKNRCVISFFPGWHSSWKKTFLYFVCIAVFRQNIHLFFLAWVWI